MKETPQLLMITQVIRTIMWKQVKKTMQEAEKLMMRQGPPHAPENMVIAVMSILSNIVHISHVWERILGVVIQCSSAKTSHLG